MRNERILHADDTGIARDGMLTMFEVYGVKGGHELLPQASSVAEVEKMMKDGIKPTIAILDNKMPNDGDGEKAASIVREYSPETVIISLSANRNVTFGDYNFTKNILGKELFDFITNLKA
jgi:CheY-like chemotaxis protein